MKLILTLTIVIQIILIPPLVICSEADLEVSVVDVINGTTIMVLMPDGSSAQCAYIGVSASLKAKDALNFNRSLVAGKSVKLEFDEQRCDNDGRLMAYVYCDDVFVNAEIIKQGYGSVFIVSPNTKHAEYFLKLEDEARENKRGIWTEPAKLDASNNVILALEKRIAEIEAKIEELSKRIDQLAEIVRNSQSGLKTSQTNKTNQIKSESKADLEKTEEELDLVYVTRSGKGKKYHRLGCRALGENPEAISIEKAKRMGFEPCLFCFPEQRLKEK